MHNHRLSFCTLFQASIAGALALAGCTVADTQTPARTDERAERVATSTQASVKATSDTGSSPVNQQQLDAVVSLGSIDCTATLISPRIAIASSSCFWSFDGTDVLPHANVLMGLNVYGVPDSAGIPTDSVLRYIPRQINTFRKYENATDVAIVYLPANTEIAERAIITRPSFSSPETGSGQVAVYNRLAFSQDRLRGSASIDRNDIEDARYFDINDNDDWVINIDGMPLFTVRPDGSRDLIGVGSYNDVNDFLVADITSDLMHYWIVNHIQDPSRSANWLASHKRVAGDYWLGEVDYTGTCRTDVDPDCDHWFDATTDNCPGAYNIDQIDTFDDGVGDTCRTLKLHAVAITDTDIRLTIDTPAKPPPAISILRDGAALASIKGTNIFDDSSTTAKHVYTYTACLTKARPGNPVCDSAPVRAPVPSPKSVSALDELETSMTTLTWGSAAGPDGFEVEQQANTPGAAWVKWSFGSSGTALAPSVRTISAPTNGDYDTRYRVCALDSGFDRQCSAPVKPSRQLCVVTASCRVHGKLVVPTDTDDPNTWCSDAGGVLTRQQSCSTSTPNPLPHFLDP